MSARLREGSLLRGRVPSLLPAGCFYQSRSVGYLPAQPVLRALGIPALSLCSALFPGPGSPGQAAVTSPGAGPGRGEGPPPQLWRPEDAPPAERSAVRAPGRRCTRTHRRPVRCVEPGEDRHHSCVSLSILCPNFFFLRTWSKGSVLLTLHFGSHTRLFYPRCGTAKIVKELVDPSGDKRTD
ncbi:hypothetical protein NDU88_003553 [Pleurodeles waltl]|uniref:Uncharacterized protein n=1 Tax=Pleurodeles waltl TaxID=8319 RepID=A0AAV7WPE3_PLEWA|nr:hypothetical protein NDU88_003553 [Pleurodeles waltl]